MSRNAIISAFFGITLMYTGFLVLANHLATGIAIGCAGLFLLIKPALQVARRFGGHSGSFSHSPRPSRANRKTKKVCLKIVKSEDDKPTIH